MVLLFKARSNGAVRRHRTSLAVLLVLLLLSSCGDPDDGQPVVAGGSAAPKAVDGEQIYNRYCFSCHAAGIAGAPKVGVAEAWQPRAAKGMAALLASTKSGIPPGMPAMGLCNSCSDAEFEAAIAHMLDKSGVSARP